MGSKFKTLQMGFFVEMLEEKNLKKAIQGNCPITLHGG